MPRLSLYRPNKQNDYRFLDRTVHEMLTVGGTDLYIHKYVGPQDQGPSTDYTQPQYANQSPTNIQDLLFLENRDRAYDPNIYRLRGHYNVQNLDFDLSQFGLFLNNDIIFITVHYNDMIEQFGRKLMTGDVIELPHLLDYNPLDETIPVALKRFYQITDANYASEGFSQTWYPHLWRIKCEKLVNSEEFSQILQEPTNTDTYLGTWDKTKDYPAGYTITFGDKNYVSTTNVPPGISPPNTAYWTLSEQSNLADILSTYNKNIKINDAALAEAERLLPQSGYDQSNLYIVPTYGAFEKDNVPSGKLNQPAPPANISVSNTGAPVMTGTVTMIRNSNYRIASPAIKISKKAIKSIWDMSVDMDLSAATIDSFVQVNLEKISLNPTRIGNGSGAVEGEKLISIVPSGTVLGPYGTADNTYATADQDPDTPGFTGTEPYGPNTMDYRADCDPRFQYIARSTPRSFGYTAGYLTGDGTAPNGLPLGTSGLNGVSGPGAGISFPANPQVGDYFLRIDYKPQILFRWDGVMWVRISDKVRTGTGFDAFDDSLLSGFINDSAQTRLTDGTYVPQAQALSTILTLKPDTLPPI